MRIDCDVYSKSLRKAYPYLPNRGSSLLVTGATGLVGSCLVDLLVLSNRELGKRFDIITAGRSKDKLKERHGCYTHLGVRLLEQDMAEPVWLVDDVDYVVHGASIADPRLYAARPVETILTSIMGARNVLEYARGSGSRVLLMSSFEVYGAVEKSSISEGDCGRVDMTRIRSVYPEGKRVAELLFRSYKEEYGVDSVVARLCSVYGPTMLPDDSKAHAQFLRCALAGKDVVLKSAGSQRRTYAYVIDAVTGILCALLRGKSGSTYNVANSDSVCTVAELAAMVASQAGIRIVRGVSTADESRGYSTPQDCVLNAGRLERLGWHGAFSLEDGIAETLAIMRDWSCG